MPRNMRKFIDETGGGITAFGLFMLVAIFAVGGLAIDVTNAIRERTYLQVAADSAAHAALYTLDNGVTQTHAEAKAVALEVAEGIMPSSRFGNTITAEDIVFGYFDDTTGGFKLDPTSRRAVLVNTQRAAARGNSIGTYFLKLVGFNRWNVLRQSVFETYKPACLREGYVANGTVEITTGNIYRAGFCIHTNQYLTVTNDNTFEDGVVVSMPDTSLIDIPTDGWSTNDGLSAALRDAKYKLRILDRIDDIIAGIDDPASPYYRSYLLADVDRIGIDPKVKLDDQWQEGYVHEVYCANPKGTINVSADAILRKGVLITDCIVKFPNNVALEDVAIISKSTEDPAFGAADYFRMGVNDNCATGGGAQIITLGGVKIAALPEFYGAQIIAGKDIQFTSDAGGMMGVSLVAEGTVKGTSNSDIGFCGGEGMENNFEAWFFRMGA